jgi:hypothetical protein
LPKAVLLVVGLAAGVVAALRRRQARARADLWREATSDSSR